MAVFIAPEREQLLKLNHLARFDEVWRRQAEWFEEPNARRGGWSGVCRLGLDLPEGGQLGVFLKRQQNHQRRTFEHPFTGEPTFSCEFNMMRYLRQYGVPVLTPVFFGSETVDGNPRAILMTEELVNFQPLETLTEAMFADKRPSLAEQRLIIRGVAATVRQLHAARIQHRSLYPKHLFVRLREQNDPEVVIIDLEKSRMKFFSAMRTVYDLATLNRHAKYWSKTNRLYFFKQYLDIKKLTPWTKLICRCIYKRSTRHR